jgi:ATP-binding cassette, subfamily B, bacterial MsbA
MSINKEHDQSFYHLINGLLLHYKNHIYLLIFLMIFTAFFESIGLAILIPIFEIILDNNNESSIATMLKYPLRLFNVNNEILFLSIFFLLIIIIKNIVRLLTVFYSTKISYMIREDWITKINYSYLSQPFGDIIKFKQGYLINNLINVPTTASAGLIKISELSVSLFMIVLYYLLLLTINLKATALVSLIGIVLYFTSIKINKKYALNFGDSEVKLGQEINNSAAEIVSAMRQIRIFSLENFFSIKLKGYLKRFRELSIRFELIKKIPNSVIESLTFSIVIAFVLIMYSRAPDTLKLMIPLITIFIVSIQRLIGQLNSLVMNRVDIIRFIPAFRLVKSLLKESDNVPNALKKDYNKFSALESEIIFENVSFSYNNNEIIFDDISFSIPVGKTTAIIGESGIGKSTIADMIIGLYSPTDGKIVVNGTDLKDIDFINWKNNIGFVSQDNYLFHTTIKENIRYGNFQTSEKNLINAAKTANAHDFIMRLPEGYNTIVGDRGMLLSGGQKQRIAIARAIIRNPQVLIFDEATSALDYKTESTLLKEIFEISKGKTVIIISHRLETVKSADKILKIENGKIFDINLKDLSI